MEKQIRLAYHSTTPVELKEFMDFLNTLPGITISVSETDILVLWNEQIYRKYARHNGGKSKKRSLKAIPDISSGISFKEMLKQQEEALYRCSDVFALQKTDKTPEEIASELHISRATYFRRLKAHREAGEMTERSEIIF